MDAEITIHFEENAREAARAARMYGSMACMCCDWAEKDECDCGGAKMEDRERAGAAVTLGETNLGTGATTPPEGKTKPHMNSDPENVPDVLDRLEYESKVLGIPADQLKRQIEFTQYRHYTQNVPENLFGDGDNDSYYKEGLA